MKFAFQRALSRDPDELEKNIINQLLENIRQGLKNDGQSDLSCWMQWQELFLISQNLTQETNAYTRSTRYTLSKS